MSAVSAPTGSIRGATIVRASEVGDDEQRAARERGGRNHRAVRGADDEPHEVRRHEADEADAAGGRHGRRGQERRGDVDRDAQAAHRDAEQARLQFAARERIERPGREQAGRDRGEREREQPPRRLHVAEVAEQPEQHAAQAQVVRQGEQEAHDRAAAGGDDDAGQQQPGRGPAARAVRDREHEQHRAEGAHRGADVHHEAGGADEHEAERADRGAARDAEHVGVGEGVAQQRLHQDARQRQHDAGAEGGERARQAQLPDDGLHQRVARREPLPGRVDAGTAERERGGDRRERRGDQQQDQGRRAHPPHARTVAD